MDKWRSIIKAVKSGYRKRLLQKILVCINSCKSPDELIKSVSALDALQWVSKAWDDVKPETVQNCFVRCGFQFLDGFRGEVRLR